MFCYTTLTTIQLLNGNLRSNFVLLLCTNMSVYRSRSGLPSIHFFFFTLQTRQVWSLPMPLVRRCCPTSTSLLLSNLSSSCQSCLILFWPTEPRGHARCQSIAEQAHPCSLKLPILLCQFDFGETLYFHQLYSCCL